MPSKVDIRNTPRDVLLQIKEMNDKYNGSREWLAHVYIDDGKLKLGAPVLGDYSGVSVKPSTQYVKDQFATGVIECMADGSSKEACKKAVNEQMKNAGSSFFGAKNKRNYGITEDDYWCTIHQHPKKFGETPKNAQIRSHFSGTDIGSEVAKGVKHDTWGAMMLTYPEGKGMFKGRHNILKYIEFPGNECKDILKASNPQLTEQQINSITEDGDNIDIVDWYAYQDESAKRGYLQTVDIENATGTQSYSAPTKGYAGFAIGAVAVAVIIAFIINWRRKQKKE